MRVKSNVILVWVAVLFFGGPSRHLTANCNCFAPPSFFIMANRLTFGGTNQPIVRQQDRMEDSLICALCLHCWGKMRWCRSGCCDTLRAITADLEAREASETTLTAEVASLRRSNDQLVQEIDGLKKELADTKEDGQWKKDLIKSYRSAIKNQTTNEVRKAIHETVHAKLTAYNEFLRNRELDSVPVDDAVEQRPQLTTPKGLKAILAEANRHRPGTSTLHQLRNATARKMKCADNYRTGLNIGNEPPPKKLASVAGSRAASPTCSQLHLEREHSSSGENDKATTADINGGKHYNPDDPEGLLELSDDDTDQGQDQMDQTADNHKSNHTAE